MSMHDAVLEEMFAEFKKAPEVYHPSRLWERLSNDHVAELTRGGFDNFKRTINLKYFEWDLPGLLRYELWLIGAELLRANTGPVFKSVVAFGNEHAQGRPWRNRLVSALYRMYIAAFADRISRRDTLHMLDRIHEPNVGNPFLVRYKNRLLSQDMCHSISEFYSIAVDGGKYRNLRQIGELGAGYGRLAYVFLTMMPEVSYCIIDIPPTLRVSQEYLSRVFPHEKIFRFRPFSSFEEVRDEFMSSRIRFLMAHQIEKIPEHFFDAVININSLDEMTREQIHNYIFHIDRIGKGGYLYSKQHYISRHKENSFITQSEYPIPATWQAVYQRPDAITRNFFEALYHIQ